MKVIRTNETPKERAARENAQATTEQNKSDILFLAIMSGIELEQDEYTEVNEDVE